MKREPEQKVPAAAAAAVISQPVNLEIEDASPSKLESGFSQKMSQMLEAVDRVKGI